MREAGNHGCEAIVNSLCRMLPKPAILMTNRPKEDETYSLKELCSSFVQEKSIEKECIRAYLVLILKRKLLHDGLLHGIPVSGHLREKSAPSEYFHRRDNYCYDNMLDR